MKVCHIADVHWRGLKRHEEYRDVFTRLLNDAREQGVDRIVVAGDIVHTKTMGISPELIQQLTWWFTELAKTAKTIVTLGNHDGLILNKSRLDTITPIIKMLDNDNIIFMRDSEQWLDKEFGVMWTNFSCFDESGWNYLSPVEGLINICMFHGGIKRATTDVGWEIESECDMSLFSGYDFGMFGDIHKCQYLDSQNRFAYPGSTIQQDFSEDIDKGYLLWDIKSKDEYTSSRRIIKSPNPFYTVEWEGTPELTFQSCVNLQKGCRLRISSDSFLTQDSIKKLASLVKLHLNPDEIAWKVSDNKGQSENITIGGTSLEKTSLRDDKFHFSALREFYGIEKFTEDEWKKIDDTISKIMHSFENFESNRNTKWSIRKLEWDNTFAYGKGNRIDFSSLEGIVGLFGVNRCGKSSIPGTIMYALYNDTDRGSISNLHVINARKGDCEAKVEFEVNGNLYRAERMSYKWNNGKGQVGANTKVNLYRINEDGDAIEDISGEQRRDSDRALRSLIGEPEDFLLTSFSAQGEMNSFIRNGATDRKKMLNNFLDLGIFEEISLKLKEESFPIKNAIKRLSEIDYDSLISQCNEKIQSLSNEKSVLESKLSSLNESQLALTSELANVKSGKTGYTSSDISKKEKEIKEIEHLISCTDNEVKEADEKIESLNSKVEKINTIKTNFPIDALREELETLRILEINEAKITSELMRENEKLQGQKKSVSRLSEVPCGDQFPTCKFIRDSHRDKLLIESQQLTISALEDQLNQAKVEISEIKKKSLEEKIKKYEKILSDEISMNGDIRTLQVEKKSYITRSIDLLKKLKDLEDSLSIMRMNRVDTSEDDSISKIDEQLQKVSNDIKECSSLLLKTERLIGSEHSTLEKYQKEKDEYASTVEMWKIYQALNNAYGKNGLPQTVLSHQLPMINKEISSILQGVCGFTVSLISNGNDLEINLDYGDSQRPVELGSGMEKMMASLAIRVALINVSSLPKTDMLIIDEGFGALDEVNVEACNRLLISLKRFFKTIIVISHVDAVKDSVDNIIEISRTGPDSFVWA